MRTTIRTLLLAAAALLLLAVPAAAQSTVDVEIQDSSFAPADVTVEVGDTVTWTQASGLPHSVTADDGSFDSSPDCAGGSECLGDGDVFSHTFDEPGEYAYYCRVHGAPGGVGMSGVITVTAADSGSEDGAEDESDTTGAEVTGSLTLADQSGDGSSVVVAEATLTGTDGWIVVHADDGGAPGPVIGHVALPEGTSSDVEVALDQALTADATVWPMLHIDAGEVGVYEFPGADGPVTADGSVVVAPLSYTVEAAGADDAGTADGSMPVTGAPLVILVVAGLLSLSGGVLAVRRRRHGG